MTRQAIREGIARAGLCTALLLAAAVTPALAERDNDPDAYVVNFFTGGGKDGVLFAAGTANQQCISQGPARIEVVSTSPGVRLSVAQGTFVVTGTDYGYLVCLGQRLPGAVVTGSGSGEAKIRVYYPPIGQWYDHTLTVGR